MKLSPQGSNQTTLELVDGTVIFFSYKMPVAAFVPGRGYMRTTTRWSRTTSKHIGQWLAREGAGDVREATQDFFDQLVKGNAV